MKSNSKDGIIIFDEVSVVRHRMNHLLVGFNIHVYEAQTDIELFNLLSNESLNIGLIIMDIGYDVNKSFRILSKIKEKRTDIPVYILTANNKRLTFVRGIAEGASDYILKPFEDAYLLDKILLLFNKKNHEIAMQISANNEIVFDIQSYFNTEFKKAQKGKYEFTVLMCTFFVPVKEFSAEIENNYIQVSDLFYQNFRSILWDTDIFERYGSQTFIGVFPFCGLANIDKIQKKLKDSFDKIIKGNKEVSSFHLAISTITYPSEADNPKELLLSLGLRMKDEIDNIKKGLLQPPPISQ